jgi:hypothetical protein
MTQPNLKKLTYLNNKIHKIEHNNVTKHKPEAQMGEVLLQTNWVVI